jgi:copper chaperone CopZ
MSSCCTPDGSCSTSSTPDVDGTATVYNVSGMTCGHCESTLTKVLGEVENVTRVEVDLRAGQVSVFSTADLDDVVIAKVVDDAGYEVTGRA